MPIRRHFGGTFSPELVETGRASIDERRQSTTGSETIDASNYDTIQAALFDIPKTVDHEVTVQIPDGTHGELFVPQFSFGKVNDSGSLNGTVVLEGDPTTPSNVAVDGWYFGGVHGNEAVRVEGVEFTGTDSTNYDNASLTVVGSGKVNLQNVIFADTTNALSAVETRGCFLQVDSGVDVSGEYKNFTQVKGAGRAQLTDGSVTVSGILNGAAIVSGGCVVSIAKTLFTENGGPLGRPKGQGLILTYDPANSLATNSLDPAHIQQPVDRSANRALGTWERNGTGNRLKVMVTVEQGSDTNLAEAVPHVNDTNTDNRIGTVRSVESAAGDAGKAMVEMEVPEGYYYKVGARSGNNISEWREQIYGIVPA